MNIIPVIDLKEGLVVSAQQGQRNTYLPINSSLCSSSSINDVIHGFLSIYPFNTVYIADLDSIENTGNNDHLINQLISDFQDIEFWIDKGEKMTDLNTIKPGNYRHIIGTESQDKKTIKIPVQFLNNIILSLDFSATQEYMGPSELFENSDLWPQDIIIMTLGRVGTHSGPDLERLNNFCKKHPENNFIAAGGIRNQNDLLKLKQIGINHALIASALHSGDIDIEVIRGINQTKKCPG